VKKLKQQFKDGILPDPTLTYAEWAEKYFILPPGSSVPGLINLKLTPYLVEPLENLSWTSPVLQEYWMKGIQIAVSTINDIVLNAVVDYFRCPVIFYHGSDGMALEYVKLRLEPLFENNPRLKGIIKDGGTKDGKSTHRLKIFPGGSIKITGGTSEHNYRSYSAAIVLIDDVDALPKDVGGSEKTKGQGNPIDLAITRTNARQGKFKVFVQGSPTDKDTSLIYEAFKTTDQRYYFCPCPFCSHLQTIDFFRIKFDRDKKGNLEGEPKLECESCKKLIEERYKFSMMQPESGAKWISTKESSDPLIVGRHLSSAYSMLGYTWLQMVKDFLKASNELKKGNQKKMVTFYNTKLGLPWDNHSKVKIIDHTKLYEDREDYTLPPEAVILIAGCDVQANRIEVLVAGHNEDSHIYCIEHKIIGGNTLIDYGLPGSPWNELEKYLKTPFKNKYGGDQPILHTALDMGFRSITASPFLEKVTATGLEITGVFGSSAKAAKKKNFIGEPASNKYGVSIREINVNEGKTMIHNKLERGLIHFSKHPSFTDEFFRQFTVERFDEKIQAWVCPDHARNEAFDILNYSNAGKYIYVGPGGVDWDDFKLWNEKGCLINDAQTEDFKIISSGIKV